MEEVFHDPNSFLHVIQHNRRAIKFPRHYCCHDVHDSFYLYLSDVNCVQETLHSIAEDDDGDCYECVENVSSFLVGVLVVVEFQLS